MQKLYTPCILNEKIVLEPCQINNNIDSFLENKIKNKFGNKCIRDGYIEKNSIKLLSRSIGKINTNHLNGTISYIVTYSADVCNPLENTQLNVTVINKNKLGLLATNGNNKKGPLSIVVPKDQHVNKQLFEEIDVGDKIRISVTGKRYELFDEQISVIGQLINKV